MDDFYDSPYKSITLSYDPEDVCDIDENNVHFDIVDGGISCAHANSSSEDAVASTCHTNGHNAYTVCYDCNTVISGSADPLPLDPSNHEGETELRGAAAPNCTGSGYSGDRYCLGCGAMIAEGEVLSALGHDYAGNVTDPTCTEQGYTTYTCTRCGDSYVDDYTAALGHTGGTATCHSKAVCEVCGTEYGEFDPDNHTGGTELRNERPISMTQAGYTGDTYCLGCDALLEPGEEFFVPGDADLDGELGVTDLIRLKKHLIDSSVEISVFADISGNGLILPNDLEYMRALIIGAEYTIVEP